MEVKTSSLRKKKKNLNLYKSELQLFCMLTKNAAY
jgi:hypothetical protein